MKKIILACGLLLALNGITNAQVQDSFFNNLNGGIAQPNFSLTGIQNNLSDNDPFEDSIKKRMEKYDLYISKRKNQQTGAWVLLGAGSLALGIGVLTFPDEYYIIGSDNSSLENRAIFSTTIFFVGVAAMLSSIPFFISSTVSRHKAKALISSNELAVDMPLTRGKKIIGLTLSVPIGK